MPQQGFAVPVAFAVENIDFLSAMPVALKPRPRHWALALHLAAADATVLLGDAGPRNFKSWYNGKGAPGPTYGLGASAYWTNL